MLFSQIEFFVFFAAVLTLLALIRNLPLQKAILLAASYYFYAYWDYRFISLIIFSTLVDFTIAQAITRTSRLSWRKLLLATSLLTNLGLLGFFKYFNFFIESAAPLLKSAGLHPGTLNIILPIGISFYTFQTLSYTIDVYRKKIIELPNLLDFALFVAFFPQLVAGPIVRASHFLPQLQKRVHLEVQNLLEGSRLFLFGLTKKLFIADRVAIFVDPVFATPALFDTPTLWLAALGYSLQIYMDFSGYSDMAIGVARCMGYDLGENFNYPYLSKSLSNFWRRWHISLSSWVRDYLYIPLGGNRGGQLRTSFNLLTSMLIMGLWHGAAWTFVAWGGLHGTGLLLERVTRLSPNSKASAAFGWFYTSLFVVLGWVLFRSEDFHVAGTIINRMFLPASGISWMHPFCIFALGITVVYHILHSYGYSALFTRRWAWYTPGLLFCLAWTVILFYPRGFNPFIYFQF